MAGLPPIINEIAPVKSEPFIVTTEPIEPACGENEVIIGGGVEKLGAPNEKFIE
jgi:hypothetical protein